MIEKKNYEYKTEIVNSFQEAPRSFIAQWELNSMQHSVFFDMWENPALRSTFEVQQYDGTVSVVLEPPKGSL